MTFDELRAANPDLVVNLYAMEPGGLVTLELITPDGDTFTFRGETADAAVEQAFPERHECPNTGLACVPVCDWRAGCAGLRVPLNQWLEPDPPIFDTEPSIVETNVFD